MQTISRGEAVAILTRKDGKIKSCGFVKRTDRKARNMNFRLGVSKGVTGEGQKFNARARGLLTVFTMNGDPSRGGYRMIPIEGIYEVAANGKRYIVSEDNDGA